MLKKSLLLLLAALMLLCGCSDNAAKNQKAVEVVVSTDTTLPPMDLEGPFIDEIVTRKYSKEWIETIAEFEGTNDELFEQFPVECRRDTAHGYRAMYLGDGDVAMIVVDEPLGTRYGYSMYLSKTRADFEALPVGTPLSAVQELDPKGNYAFGSAAWDIAENLSWHATTDGYLIFIRYTADYTIASVQVELL